MLGLYINSFLAGAGLGILQAFIFFRENMRILRSQQIGAFMLDVIPFDVIPSSKAAFINKIGSFFGRYILLFLAFWILFVKYQLNMYWGIGGFFLAFWGVLLKKVKDHRES